jgi:hypothetical protein
MPAAHGPLTPLLTLITPGRSVIERWHKDQTEAWSVSDVEPAPLLCAVSQAGGRCMRMWLASVTRGTTLTVQNRVQIRTGGEEQEDQKASGRAASHGACDQVESAGAKSARKAKTTPTTKPLSKRGRTLPRLAGI